MCWISHPKPHFTSDDLHSEMPFLIWCVLLPSMAIVNIAVSADGSYCSPGQPKPGDPSLPLINVTAFTIEYQITIIEGRYTMWAREDYDFTSNKVRMTMNKNGREEAIIMDYNDNFILTYQYYDIAKTSYSCTIEQLNTSKSDNFHLFGGVRSGSGSMPHIYSSADVFRFESSLGETYLGNTTVDGVPVDHWQSCMYWEDDKDNFTLDYYFTTSDWTPVDPNSPKQIPIRAIVTGVKDIGSGKDSMLNHVYDYLNFRVFPRLPEENFALPVNMQCQDTYGLRKKPLPRMPSRMSYTVETVNGATKMTDVLYDEDRRLTRTLENNVISIDDFNTGVHYSIDKTTQICSTRPISSDLDSNAVNSTRYISLKGQQELFYLDGDFTYTGQADVRGIRCDAWLGTTTVQGVSSDVEVYFSLTSEKYKNPISGQVLVSVTVSRDENVTSYNFFNQVSSPDYSTNPFDITACRNESSMMEFRIVFSYSPEEVFQEHQQYSLIHDALSSLVVQLTGISPLLVHWTDLEVDGVNKQLHWLGRLLDPDPDFKRASVVNATSSMSPFQALSIIQQLVNDGRLVTTVLLPPEGTSPLASLNLSALEIRNVSSAVDFTDTSDISLGQFMINYNMLVVNFDPEERVYASSALSCADLCVQRIIYDCTSFSYCFSSRQCQLSSKLWDNETLVPTTACNFYIRDSTSDFMKIPGRTTRPADLEPTLGVLSVQTCARLCVKEAAFHCESFDYCASSQDCYLGRSHYYGTSQTDISNSTFCDHYSRNYVSDYDKSSNTMLVLNNSSSQAAQLVVVDSSPSVCAYICSQDAADCARFSFCSSNRQCQLVTSYTMRSIKTLPSSVCDVYTLKSSGHPIGPGKNDTSSSHSIDADSETTFSSRSLAGLAVGMIFVGVLICAAIIFVLRWFKIWKLF